MKILVLGRSFHPQGKETAKLIADELKPYIEKLGANIDYAQIHCKLIFGTIGIKVWVNKGEGGDF